MYTLFKTCKKNNTLAYLRQVCRCGRIQIKSFLSGSGSGKGNRSGSGSESATLVQSHTNTCTFQNLLVILRKTGVGTLRNYILPLADVQNPLDDEELNTLNNKKASL